MKRLLYFTLILIFHILIQANTYYNCFSPIATANQLVRTTITTYYNKIICIKNNLHCIKFSTNKSKRFVFICFDLVFSGLYQEDQ